MARIPNRIPARSGRGSGCGWTPSIPNRCSPVGKVSCLVPGRGVFRRGTGALVPTPPMPSTLPGSRKTLVNGSLSTRTDYIFRPPTQAPMAISPRPQRGVCGSRGRIFRIGRQHRQCARQPPLGTCSRKKPDRPGGMDRVSSQPRGKSGVRFVGRARWRVSPLAGGFSLVLLNPFKNFGISKLPFEVFLRDRTENGCKSGCVSNDI